MEPTEVVALIVVCVTVTIVSVALLRPISKQLGKLFEAMAQERSRPLPPPDVARVRELLETLNARLDRLEERQDFTDSLLAGGERPRALGSRPGSHEG